MLPHLPPDTTLLRAAKRTRAGNRADAVHPHHTGIDPRAETQRAADILREDASHQAVLAVVADVQDVVLLLKLVDDDNGAEDFLVVDEGCVLRVREYCRLNEIALLIVSHRRKKKPTIGGWNV